MAKYIRQKKTSSLKTFRFTANDHKQIAKISTYLNKQHGIATDTGAIRFIMSAYIRETMEGGI
jgi:hypothetical protein